MQVREINVMTGVETVRDMTPDEIASFDQTIPTPQAISFTQLLIGLVSESWITESEGEAWLAGVLPSKVLLLIDNLPPEQRFAVKARATRPSVVLRNDPLVASMGAAAGKTVEEIDAFFQTYSTV